MLLVRPVPAECTRQLGPEPSWTKAAPQGLAASVPGTARLPTGRRRLWRGIAVLFPAAARGRCWGTSARQLPRAPGSHPIVGGLTAHLDDSVGRRHRTSRRSWWWRRRCGGLLPLHGGACRIPHRIDGVAAQRAGLVPGNDI